MDHINQIVRLITEDPDVINEAEYFYSSTTPNLHVKPDASVFYLDLSDLTGDWSDYAAYWIGVNNPSEKQLSKFVGWYAQERFAGGEPEGPFDSQKEAITAFRALNRSPRRY